jgi:tetratricopeptide (TPR) repeat protein
VSYTRPIEQPSSRPRGRRPGLTIDPEALRRTRLAAGLSLAEVGGTELTRQAVHLFETGRANPSARSLQILAGRLGVAMESLLRRSDRDRDVSILPDRRFEDLLETNRLEEVERQARDVIDNPASTAPARAAAQLYLGQALILLDRPVEAAAWLRRSRAVAEAIGDPWLAAEALGFEASALHAQDSPGALRLGEEALARYRALQPRRDETEARMLERLGTFLVRRQAYERAEAQYELALELAGPVRNLTLVARAYHGMAFCHADRGDLRRAVDLCQMAVALYSVESRFRPQAAGVSLPRAENDLGAFLLKLGQLERAEECFAAAVEHFARGRDAARGHALVSLAELRIRQRRCEEAHRLLNEAAGLAEEVRDVTTLAVAMERLGGLYAAEGSYERAEGSFLRALGILDEAGLHERRRSCEAAYRRMLAARAGLPELQASTS